MGDGSTEGIAVGGDVANSDGGDGDELGSIFWDGDWRISCIKGATTAVTAIMVHQVEYCTMIT